MAAAESGRPASLAAAVAEVAVAEVAVVGSGDGWAESKAAVEWSSAMPPTPRVTTSTVTSSGINILLLRGRGSSGVTSLIFPALRSGHSYHDQARCPADEV